jgi:PAS domain-containing protein
MNKIMRNKILFKLLLPGLYIGIVLIIDYFEPMGTITPFFAVIGMLFMALNFRPAVMIPWGIIYSAIICSIFLVPRLYVIFSSHPYYDQYTIPIIRAATYVIVGGISCYVSILLDRMKKTEKELNSILRGLPSPILTSDHNGKILYCNQAAETLMPILREKKKLLSYFDLLAETEFYGRTIATYIYRMEHDKHTKPLELNVNGRPFNGHTQLIYWGHQKVMLTVLAEAGEGKAIPHLISS